MKRIGTIAAAVLLAALPASAAWQEAGETPSFDGAGAALQKQLEESLAELSSLRDRIADEKVPLSTELSGLEDRLISIRKEYQEASRLLDSRTLDLSNLRTEIKARKEEQTYLSGLLGQYVGNFEAHLQIAEQQRYEEVLKAARLAPEDVNLAPSEVYQAQAALVDAALGRLEDALGGTRFEGSAVGADGLLRKGTFVMVGPVALFASADGGDVGTAVERLGSLEPTQIPFGDPKDTERALAFVQSSAGDLPLDPTLGNAHKIEATHETFVEHVKKGGPVMVPIFVLAGLALLVALYKWVSLSLMRKASKAQVAGLLGALADHDLPAARETVRAIKGPVGRMLAAGVEHVREPRELIEEVMYETVLKTRLKLQGFLPFIAICASSAPLLGLLGTVTGIINTFKLITVFGSGDVKTLSGGISEALITTEFGLIVAIPSLLIHAFLNRKVRGIVSQMESAGLALVNQISRAPFPALATGEPDGRAASGGEEEEDESEAGQILVPVAAESVRATAGEVH